MAPKRGKTTAVVLATGTVVVLLLAGLSFWKAWLLQSDVVRIQGRWEVMTVSNSEMLVTTGKMSARNGSDVSAGSLGHYVFEGETVQVFGFESDLLQTYRYRLDENHQPRWFNLLSQDDSHNSWPGVGVYELNGDTLMICLNAHRLADLYVQLIQHPRSEEKRPTAFEPQSESPNHILVILKRE